MKKQGGDRKDTEIKWLGGMKMIAACEGFKTRNANLKRIKGKIYLVRWVHPANILGAQCG